MRPYILSIKLSTFKVLTPLLPLKTLGKSDAKFTPTRTLARYVSLCKHKSKHQRIPINSAYSTLSDTRSVGEQCCKFSFACYCSVFFTSSCFLLLSLVQESFRTVVPIRPPTFPSLLSTPQLHSFAAILHADPDSYRRTILPQHLCLPTLLSRFEHFIRLLHVHWICVQHSGEEPVQRQSGRGEHLRQ